MYIFPGPARTREYIKTSMYNYEQNLQLRAFTKHLEIVLY